MFQGHSRRGNAEWEKTSMGKTANGWLDGFLQKDKQINQPIGFDTKFHVWHVECTSRLSTLTTSLVAIRFYTCSEKTFYTWRI